MKNILAILATLVIIMSAAEAATQNVRILWYEPHNEFGLPSVILVNNQSSEVKIKDLELKVYGNSSLQTIKIKKVVTLAITDGNGDRGWIPIQLDGISKEFLEKERWNVTRIEITGYLYRSGENVNDVNEYKPLELIDAWNLDPSVMRNASLRGESDAIFHGAVFNPPVPDYVT